MRQRRFYTVIVTALLGGAALSGCSWLKEWPPADQPARYNQAAKPTVPQAQLMQTADATWLVPPPKDPPTVSHMVPAHGEQVSTINRVRELEGEIAQLRSEMSSMVPAMTRLAQTQTAMHDVLQDAVHQSAAAQATAQSAVQTAAAVQAPQGASAAPAVAAPQALATAADGQPLVNSDSAITGARFGEHNGRSRIILDSAQIPVFEPFIDKTNNILTVRLPRTVWQPAPSQTVSGAPLIASYNAMPDGAGGTILAVQLRQPAAIATAQALPPGTGRGHRLLIDLAAQ